MIAMFGKSAGQQPNKKRSKTMNRFEDELNVHEEDEFSQPLDNSLPHSGQYVDNDEPFLETEEQAHNTSLFHFCQFVDNYTRLSNDPIYTAAVCENQAEMICITQHDLSQETIYMLIETLLNVIDHLAKKWLDEQMQREDLEQQLRKNLRQKYTQSRLKPAYQRWIRRTWKKALRGKHVTRKKIIPC
jgi:hypothetical protein